MTVALLKACLVFLAAHAIVIGGVLLLG